MILNDIASIRTGLVTARKKASDYENNVIEYKLINLKCIAEAGYLDLLNTEPYYSVERLKADYLTRMGDILIRLSAPYTSVMITSEEWCNYLVPSHFTIIRVDKRKAAPEYVFWFLKRDTTRQKIMQNSSGSSAFGTISSGFFTNLKIRDIPLQKQKIVGELLMLSEKEQELLYSLAAEKAKYNKFLVNQIYDTFKRGN